jgi:hypothetical protein
VIDLMTEWVLTDPWLAILLVVVLVLAVLLLPDP